ncbi:unnamed protein product [Diabrotica balteata]|uniref:Tyrosinase copper-binding domain-containing protein n=1 Tax=Diabrotica balteata TaxID=107213 RepID=A0A9P0GUA5_DIABA|nr:unnamed protein product [Diabrotica balteata]
MNAKESLTLLFDRPGEPLSLPKGKEGVRFLVPSQYMQEDYQHSADENQKPFEKLVITPRSDLNSNEEQKTVRVNYIELPSLTEITELGKNDNFSLFIPKHQKIAAKLTSLFMGMKTCDDLLSLAACARERVNPLLFNYALSVALLHRNDTKDLDLPSVVFSFPHKYIDSHVFSKVAEAQKKNSSQNKKTPIIMPMSYTASNLEVEHRLAYFREDIGVNLHHWHWHLVYPNTGDDVIVRKDRRGELFYYMHQQIVARYNFERLCNGLNRVERYTNFNEPIREAYYPKINSMVGNRTYPARVPNMRWQNVQRDFDEAGNTAIDIEQMERWRHRIYNAINLGFARDESGGVMGDSATAMRDPFFYRWHANIDDIFQNHKNNLARYTEQQLNFANVVVQDVKVQTQNTADNIFETFWQQSDLDLSRGLDFQERGSVFVRFTHLQHKPFSYTITVNNTNNSETVGTCRIFMAPKFDEKGNPWLFKHQKNMFIELDKFTVNLKPGSHPITRKSSDSSVTIPFGRTYRDLEENRPDKSEVNALAQFDFCGCGWPENLLIPKGNDRFQAELFVMISDYAGDRVDQSVTGKTTDAGSYCGLRDKKYPDRRSMGYPFDRLPRDNVTNLQQFLTPNMFVKDVIIQFKNQIATGSNVSDPPAEKPEEPWSHHPSHPSHRHPSHGPPPHRHPFHGHRFAGQ